MSSTNWLVHSSKLGFAAGVTLGACETIYRLYRSVYQVQVDWLFAFVLSVALLAYGMMGALGGIAFGLLASRYPRLRPWVPHLGHRMIPTIVVFSLLMVVVALVLRPSGFDLRAPRSSPPDLPKPNVILLVADSFRQDVLERPDARELAPVLSRFYAEHTHYTAAQSIASWTRPAMSGLLTGQAPSRIGTHRDNLSERAITVAELLHTAGYETIGVSDNYLTCADVGFGQGHERYYCPNNQRLFRSMFVYRYLPERFKRWAARDLRLLYQGAETLGVVAERFLIERDPTRPFYLLIHYMDVHYPFYVYRGDAGNVSNLSMPESFVPYFDILLAMEEQPRPPFSNFQLPRDQATDLQHRYLGGVQHRGCPDGC